MKRVLTNQRVIAMACIVLPSYIGIAVPKGGGRDEPDFSAVLGALFSAGTMLALPAYAYPFTIPTGTSAEVIFCSPSRDRSGPRLRGRC